MPQAAEVRPLVLELPHFDDLWKCGDALDEGIFDRLSHAPRERHEPLEGERLVAKEDDEVLEEGAPDRRDGLVREILPEIHSEDLGAERTRDAPDLHAYCSILMFWLLMIAP